MILNLIKKNILLLAAVSMFVSPHLALAADANEINDLNETTPVTVDTKIEYQVINTSTHTITAYTSEAGQTDNTPCITANGFDVCAHGEEDILAANFLKMGTKVRIPELFGDRIFTVSDRMNRRHATRLDVWMKSKDSAINFGIKKAKIEILAEAQ